MAEVESKLHRYSFGRYDTFERWASYWHQIKSVVDTPGRTVLLVGSGNNIVPNYLRNEGREVWCADLEPSLKPDFVTDVRQLSRHVDGLSFEIVCAFQVLEHLPYTDFVPALKQLAAVSRGAVILSLPFTGVKAQLRFRLGRRVVTLGRMLPWARSRPRSRWHQWEIGLHAQPLKQILADIHAVMRVRRHYPCADNPYHYFFECELK